MTRSLWRTLADGEKFKPNDARLQDVLIYLAFAVLGMIGFNRQQYLNGRTLLVPVAFASGDSIMRVTVHPEPGVGDVITLSLPAERIG